MDSKYSEPVSVTELRNCYEVAYGEHGVYHLLGALFANLPYETIERLYDQGLEKVREDMAKLEKVS